MTETRPPTGTGATRRYRSANLVEPSNASTSKGSAPKKTANKRITTNLVALSSVAILSVYGIGYARTQSSADALASSGAAVAPPNPLPVAKSHPPTPGVPTVTTVSLTTGGASSNPSGTKPAGQPAPSLPAPAPTIGSGAALATSATAAPSAVPAASATAAPATATTAPVATSTPKPSARTLRDGSYVGDGFSRHGDIEATVVVSGGKVISADVTGCGTRYSCRLVIPLVSEVVSRQTAPIDLISGATDSSHAYRDAIIKALSQAT